MTREEKAQAIENLTVQLGDSTNIYLTDVSGLDAAKTSNLRRACFKAGIELTVVKNTLLAKAMEASDKNFGDLTDVLKGNTAMMFSEVGNAPAKVIKDFRKKSDRPILKGAYIEEAIYLGDDQVEALGIIIPCFRYVFLVVSLLLAPQPQQKARRKIDLFITSQGLGFQNSQRGEFCVVFGFCHER